jgi:AraC-like DNA-binding protein
VVARVVGHARIPERTLKRRFKQATGLALIDYVQNLRIEEAKHLLETSDQAVDEICFYQLPKRTFQSQQQPSRPIEEVIEARGFARTNGDGRNADRRLANRRLCTFCYSTPECGPSVW